MTNQHKPLAMGLVMGPLMLWMLHGQLTDQALSGTALALFIGAHVLIIGVLAGASLFATRLSPRLQRWVHQFHRPSVRHLCWMLTGLVLSASVVHLSLHGIS